MTKERCSRVVHSPDFVFSGRSPCFATNFSMEQSGAFVVGSVGATNSQDQKEKGKGTELREG